MTREQPWDVRHIYTTADPCFERYLTKLNEKLRASKQAGWIQNLCDCPIGQDSGISPAIQASGWDELVIVDLHGWIGDQCPWLGTSAAPGLWLSELPTSSWSASVIFLTGCLGGTPEFGGAARHSPDLPDHRRFSLRGSLFHGPHPGRPDHGRPRTGCRGRRRRRAQRS